jgi:hypothetical protein
MKLPLGGVRAQGSEPSASAFAMRALTLLRTGTPLSQGAVQQG